MDLFQPYTPTKKFASPSVVARYAPIFWEPVPGTGERVVALIAMEPHETTSVEVTAGTFVVLSSDRLRSMLGRQRGAASLGILREAARFMTERQLSGVPLMNLVAPFHGFTVGPRLSARGYSTHQLIDAAVRSSSAFGNSDEMIEEDEIKAQPRHTVRTAEFIRTLRREVAGDDLDVRSRFDKSFTPKQGLPELTIDYAFRKWMIQVTSLPTTSRQAINALRESQSKLYEIDVLRKHMRGLAISPVLLINEDALHTSTNEQARAEATRMKERLEKLAKSDGLDVINAASAFEAAGAVAALT